MRSLRTKPDCLPGLQRRLKQATDRFEHLPQLAIVGSHPAFEGPQVFGYFGVSAGGASQSYEGSDDEHAHFHGLRAVQH